MSSTELPTKIKKVTNIVLTLAIFGLLAVLVTSGFSKLEKSSVNRKQTVCPALLSISRSARDTLIIMKAEPLCNNYVLENLK